jgi:hypothetical protein
VAADLVRAAGGEEIEAGADRGDAVAAGADPAQRARQLGVAAIGVRRSPVERCGDA